jgi:hypothetical protein
MKPGEKATITVTGRQCTIVANLLRNKSKRGRSIGTHGPRMFTSSPPNTDLYRGRVSQAVDSDIRINGIEGKARLTLHTCLTSTMVVREFCGCSLCMKHSRGAIMEPIREREARLGACLGLEASEVQGASRGRLAHDGPAPSNLLGARSTTINILRQRPFRLHPPSTPHSASGLHSTSSGL